MNALGTDLAAETVARRCAETRLVPSRATPHDLHNDPPLPPVTRTWKTSLARSTVKHLRSALRETTVA